MTDRASAQDIARLTQRANRSGPALDLAVERLGQSELRTFTYNLDALDTFIAEETERLVRWDIPRGSVISYRMNDRRSPKEFDEQVARYLERLPTRAVYHAALLAVDARLGDLNLAVVNNSALNYSSTQVVLRVPMEDVPVYFDTGELEEDLDDMKIPRSWGYDQLMIAPRIMSPVVLPPPVTRGGEMRRDDDGSMVVTLPPVDVRPHTTHVLEPVYLVLADVYAGKTIEVAWRATSTSADGDAAGVVALTVDPEPVDLTHDLFADEEELLAGSDE